MEIIIDFGSSTSPVGFHVQGQLFDDLAEHAAHSLVTKVTMWFVVRNVTFQDGRQYSSAEIDGRGKHHTLSYILIGRRRWCLGVILLCAVATQIGWIKKESSFFIFSSIRDGIGTQKSRDNQVSIPETPPHYAYAFVISGCNPEVPSYRNYLYNILIATRNLKEFGSQADVVAFFQMAWKANATVLPSQDESMLRAMGIKIKYISKHEQESFYRTMLDKFRVIGLIEYERVILVDGDVMPMGNLDYLFHMSNKGILRENVVMQGSAAPMNGGFFLVATGGLPEINDIIQRRQKEAQNMEFPYFNLTAGWGHVFHAPNDTWTSRAKSDGVDWNFHGGFADQGLLLYWVKYVKQDVSICMNNGTVQNWFADANGHLVVQSIDRPFLDYSYSRMCWGRYCSSPPMSDYHHFSGRSKPWLHGPPGNLDQDSSLESARHYWFWQLKQIDSELQLGLNFDDWQRHQIPTLGLWPHATDILNASVDLLT